MKEKTAKQLLRLVINGRGLRETVATLAELCHNAARLEDDLLKYEDKCSPFHTAAHTLGEAATVCCNDDLAGVRVYPEEPIHVNIR